MLARISAGSRLEHYARGAQVLAHEPRQRDLLVVVSGSIEMSGVNAGGARFVLARAGPGVIVNLVRLLPGLASTYYCHAIEDSLLVHMPADHFGAVLDDHPTLWRDMTMLALSRQQDSIVTLQRRGFGLLEQSLAEALLGILRTQGAQATASAPIRLRVSQEDLAAMVSVSRQTINKGLRLLTQSRILSVAYGELEIHDPAALQQLAETGMVPDTKDWTPR